MKSYHNFDNSGHDEDPMFKESLASIFKINVTLVFVINCCCTSDQISTAGTEVSAQHGSLASLRAPSGVRRQQEFDVTPLLSSFLSFFLSFFQSEAKFEFGGKEDFLHLSKLQAK